MGAPMNAENQFSQTAEQHAPDPAALRKAAKSINSTAEYSRKYRKIDHFRPYQKQREFMTLGATMRERCYMAANRAGKSETAMVEVVYHATGEYPRDWKGVRYSSPPNIVISSENRDLARDINQQKLFGKPGVDEEFGTGFVPLDSIVGKPSMSRGVANSYDTVSIRHSSGGISVIQFKSYQAGEKSFMGTQIHVMVFDEPPPIEVYAEALTRTSAVANGRMLVVFTPIDGSTDVVRRFTDEENPDRAMVRCTLYDIANEPNGHLTLEQVRAIEASCLPHQVRTRVYGEPAQGDSPVFPISETAIMEPPILDIPLHWYKLWAIDFGINHPFGAVLILHDRDTDCVHVHACVRMKDATPLMHAVPIKRIAANVRIAYPSDGDNREAGSGTTLANLYREQDLQLLPGPARWEDGSVSTERGIMEMWTRMQTGRLKVSNTLREWFEEFRSYHRKDSQIVKIRDDLMSATRIAIMQLRSARQGPIGPLPSFGRRFRPGEGPGGDPNSPENIARRNDFNLFTGEAHEYEAGSKDWLVGLRDPRLGPVGGTSDIDAFTGKAVQTSSAAGMWPTPERRQ
jgi:phage terminase large subunit-like protein